MFKSVVTVDLLTVVILVIMSFGVSSLFVVAYVGVGVGVDADVREHFGVAWVRQDAVPVNALDR